MLLANLIHIVKRLTMTPHDSDVDGTHNHMLNLDGLIRHTLRIARKFQMAGTPQALRSVLHLTLHNAYLDVYHIQGQSQHIP